ncbi:hypothetical protein KZX46_05000 [Polymorphobacter sp. PAMC 29334]|uniref:hypothetical protein n=1 Tax=Polymorphobacter sp. PAMC 29334 TaxID=2862331 RepID=UPI001C784905|nr:hypothetical protein [Polymorphobacter sp. PAMC 29334]QYE35346.1 hypothetical protein KZX46_05000 [Polymorphobacter sp. PAMC 29334]
MKPATNRRLRQIHHYLGVFFAPAILLFAVSGALQTFRLNEAKGAPAWMDWIATVHKDQETPQPRPPRPAGERPRAPKAEPAAPKHNPFALKVFVAIMSIGLIASTLLGVAIALSIRSMRRLSLTMLVLGTLLPLALLLI